MNWADGCDFPRQDFDHIPNTKKEACGQLCLANPKCDHFTWDVRDNGKCWLKKWIGDDNPSVTRDRRRCGFVKRQASVSNIQQSTMTTQEPRPQSTTTQRRRPSGIGKNNITSNQKNYFYLFLLIDYCYFFTEYKMILVWKVDGEVNWSDHCDFLGQDFAYIAKTNKDVCGQLCLANPKCDHFTWNVLDNGKCQHLPKHWIGDSPSIQEDGRRCGFIPSRVIDLNILKATVSQLQSQLSGIKSIIRIFC